MEANCLKTIIDKINDFLKTKFLQFNSTQSKSHFYKNTTISTVHQRF